jgi:hypothetical protein
MQPKIFTCPYDGCKREFERLILLTNFSGIPMETYYACPHCLTEVDVVAKDSNLNSVSAETTPTPAEKTTMECAHHLGHLKTLPREAPVPDECSVCPKLLKCY